MEKNQSLTQAREMPPVDAETEAFVRHATAQLVNAAITRRLSRAAQSEATRARIEMRVWRGALGAALFAAALLALFMLQRPHL
jgi:hypothetical protein